MLLARFIGLFALLPCYNATLYYFHALAGWSLAAMRSAERGGKDSPQNAAPCGVVAKP